METEDGGKRSTRVRGSKAYALATRRAKSYLEQPGKLKALVAAAGSKAEARSGPLAAIMGPVKDGLRLVRAYANGSYRDISWQSLLMLVAAVVYFVMPLDLVPDFLLGFGLLDDAAILGWTLRTLSRDLESFRAWEAATAPPPADTSDDAVTPDETAAQ